MKRNLIYVKAQEIYEKMYQFQETLSQNRKMELYKKYLFFIRKSAYQGNAEAQYELAQQYEDVNYLYDINPNYNPKKCIYWYTKASQQNHPASCNNLAYFYELGRGCKQNIKKALALYKKSADLGYSIGKENYKLMLKQYRKKLLR